MSTTVSSRLRCPSWKCTAPYTTTTRNRSQPPASANSGLTPTCGRGLGRAFSPCSSTPAPSLPRLTARFPSGELTTYRSRTPGAAPEPVSLATWLQTAVGVSGAMVNGGTWQRAGVVSGRPCEPRQPAACPRFRTISAGVGTPPLMPGDLYRSPNFSCDRSLSTAPGHRSCRSRSRFHGRIHTRGRQSLLKRLDCNSRQLGGAERYS
jgi:hypothetical protein